MSPDEARLDGEFSREVFRAIDSVHRKHKLAPRTRMLQMIQQHQGARAAWRSMPPEELTTGLVDLAGADLLYLTIEYHMLKPKYAALFTLEERKEAYRALKRASIEAHNGDESRAWDERVDESFVLQLTGT